MNVNENGRKEIFTNYSAPVIAVSSSAGNRLFIVHCSLLASYAAAEERKLKAAILSWAHVVATFHSHHLINLSNTWQ